MSKKSQEEKEAFSRCQSCKQELRIACHDCGRQTVVDQNGRLSSHMRSTCLGSHVEWSTCKASGKELKAPHEDDRHWEETLP